jgi:hypothetical protein
MTLPNKALRASYWISLNSYVIFGSYQFRFRFTERDQPASLKMPELQEYYYTFSASIGAAVNCKVSGG